MPMPPVDDVGFCDDVVRDLTCGGKPAEGAKRARASLAAALSDAAIVHLANGERPAGMALLRQAFDLNTAEQVPLHNFVAALAVGNELRGRDLGAVKHRVLALQNVAPWAEDYRPLLFLPVFLNLEFVSGKCNLHCRMCVGVQDERYPNKFQYMPAAAFEAILASSPSITGVTLSSGDSDPLLHPQLDEVFRLAAARNVAIDIYTNGHALTDARARKMVETGAVKMLNVSLDAATPETYRRIRGGDLARVLANVERLQQLKAAAGATVPWLSMSMVVMADNVQELPAFVEMAHRLGAGRVNLEDLIGWQDRPSDNRNARDNPDAARHLRAAHELAARVGMTLFVPEGLRALLADAPPAPVAPAASSATPAVAAEQPGTLGSCSWAEGLFVNHDASISPCCMVHRVADMGSVHDGAIHANTKYVRVKELLFSGKVFRKCAGQPCQFVQQQKARGVPLQFMTDADLGDLAPRPEPVAAVALTVHGRAVAAA